MAEIWIWTCKLSTGENIANGVADTRLAAKVAVQRAHEHWLKLNGKRFNLPSRVSYHWQDLDSYDTPA